MSAVIRDLSGNNDSFKLRGSVHQFASKAATGLTASDVTVYAVPFRSLYVGGTGGTVKLRTVDGGTVILSGISAGSVVPVQFDKLFSTDTTATGLVGLR